MQHRRIYLVGFMGAGKSTVGRVLASRLGWDFIDLDEAIESGEGLSVPQIFIRHGETHFRNLERQYLERASGLDRVVIALGGGAFSSPENRDLAGRTGVTVWLKVSFPKVAERVRIDGTRPMFESIEKAEHLYRSRESSYRQAKLHITAGDNPPELVAADILRLVSET